MFVALNSSSSSSSGKGGRRGRSVQQLRLLHCSGATSLDTWLYSSRRCYAYAVRVLVKSQLASQCQLCSLPSLSRCPLWKQQLLRLKVKAKPSSAEAVAGLFPSCAYAEKVGFLDIVYGCVHR